MVETTRDCSSSHASIIFGEVETVGGEIGVIFSCGENLLEASNSVPLFFTDGISYEVASVDKPLGLIVVVVKGHFVGSDLTLSFGEGGSEISLGADLPLVES